MLNDNFDAKAFIGLKDTPTSYSGQQYKGVRVNTGETGLEFTNLSGAGSYVHAFTNGDGTTITIPGTTHNLGTYNLQVEVKELVSGDWRTIIPLQVDIDPSTNNVVVTLNTAVASQGNVLLLANGTATVFDTFLELNDTPSSYSGQANKLVVVNGTPDGLTFIDPNFDRLISTNSTLILSDDTVDQTLTGNLGDLNIIAVTDLNLSPAGDLNLNPTLDIECNSNFLNGVSGFNGSATDITGSEMETLTDGSDADSLHTHTFINLTDVPASYGGAGKAVVVNGTNDGLIFVDFAGTDEKVKVSINDTTADYLTNSIDTGGTYLTKTIVNPGFNELLKLDVDETLIPHNNLNSLQGGGGVERYHLTLTQHTDLTNFAPTGYFDLSEKDVINFDYLNGGATAGSTGYGLRDNAGTIEFKNSGGSWIPLEITDIPVSTTQYSILVGNASAGWVENTNLLINSSTISSSSAIDLQPSGDTDDYLQVLTGTRFESEDMPILKSIGSGGQIIIESDSSNRTGINCWESSTEYAIFQWHKGSTQTEIVSSNTMFIGNITGTITVQSFGGDIDITPSTGTIGFNGSDTNITGSELETLSDTSNADSLHTHNNVAINRYLTVGKSGADYTTVSAAITAANALASPSTPVKIMVFPGEYNEGVMALNTSYVSIYGSKESKITGKFLITADNIYLNDFRLLYGAPNDYGIDIDSTTGSRLVTIKNLGINDFPNPIRLAGTNNASLFAYDLLIYTASGTTVWTNTAPSLFGSVISNSVISGSFTTGISASNGTVASQQNFYTGVTTEFAQSGSGVISTSGDSDPNGLMTGTGTINWVDRQFGDIVLEAGSYANWGSTVGSGGYGIRDNSGVMEYKDSGGNWTTFASDRDRLISTNSSLILSDDASDQTLTGNLGDLYIAPTGEHIFFSGTSTFEADFSSSQVILRSASQLQLQSTAGNLMLQSAGGGDVTVFEGQTTLTQRYFLIEGPNSGNRLQFYHDATNGHINSDGDLIFNPAGSMDFNNNNLINGGAINCTTLNTGQGANELYAMDQDVQTTDDVTFNSMTGTLSATSVLADGVTATTQSPGDNTTKVATTAYVDNAVAVENLWDRNAGSGYIQPYFSGDDVVKNTTGDLGTTGIQWDNLWLSGNMSDGTNTLTIANAKDAYDKRIDTYTDSNTIDLTFSANDLTASVLYQNSTSINLSDDASGLKADIATDGVNDTHIDWGTGANQVSADDIPDGTTNAIITLTQETNFEDAYSKRIDTYTDTNSINLTFAANDLQADLIFQDSTTVDLSVDASGLKADVIPGGINHNDLANKQGGTTGEYYHLTNTAYGYLQNQDQSVYTTSDVTFNTVDTGQGANELYAMNQDVQTTDDVTFNSVTTTLSATSVLANGVTATTQAPGDNSTLVATTAYVDAAVAVENLWDRNAGSGFIQPFFANDDVVPNTSGELGLTANRWTKGWFTDLEITNYPSVNGTALTDQYLATTDAVTFATVNTGQGDNELYAMNQDVQTTDAVTFATVNTGQGDNELYAMNQDVQTTDDVTFNTLSATVKLTAPKLDYTGDITIDAINAAANSTVFILNSDGTFVANLNVEGSITTTATIQGGTITDGTMSSTAGTITNATLTTPTIADFTNANHNHTNAAGGGQLTLAGANSDVNITTPAEGQHLVYNAGAGDWENKTLQRDVFFECRSGDTYQTFIVENIASTGNDELNFRVPRDFASLVSVEVIAIPTGSTTTTAGNYTFTANYGTIGEQYNQHTGSGGFAVTFTAGQFAAVDISTLFASLAAGDYAGVNVAQANIGTAINYLGVRLVYNSSGMD